ncbi:MAG TPA: chorismate mutase [Desulfitobacterium dehalogenans]|uniref:chorismate mutase n=1 Tax=Desulfitobacterium dehalogenans TaxID=36854 RepID=A0A7C7D5L9_9FIRM|nr:chorismate mutase [Desulfitobacterium dehalogenans]
MTRVRGIRGAITIQENDVEEIRQATQELLKEMMMRNSLVTEDIISAIFTLTKDIDAAFPATFARQLGWDRVPMICLNEIPVPGSLPLCIRVLLHVESSLTQEEIHPVYLRDAVNLRRDLVE